jgi:hypothetical protein
VQVTLQPSQRTAERNTPPNNGATNDYQSNSCPSQANNNNNNNNNNSNNNSNNNTMDYSFGNGALGQRGERRECRSRRGTS